MATIVHIPLTVPETPRSEVMSWWYTKLTFNENKKERAAYAWNQSCNIGLHESGPMRLQVQHESAWHSIRTRVEKEKEGMLTVYPAASWEPVVTGIVDSAWIPG